MALHPFEECGADLVSRYAGLFEQRRQGRFPIGKPTAKTGQQINHNPHETLATPVIDGWCPMPLVNAPGNSLSQLVVRHYPEETRLRLNASRCATRSPSAMLFPMRSKIVETETKVSDARAGRDDATDHVVNVFWGDEAMRRPVNGIERVRLFRLCLVPAMRPFLLTRCRGSAWPLDLVKRSSPAPIDRARSRGCCWVNSDAQLLTDLLVVYPDRTATTLHGRVPQSTPLGQDLVSVHSLPLQCERSAQH